MFSKEQFFSDRLNLYTSKDFERLRRSSYQREKLYYEHGNQYAKDTDDQSMADDMR